MSNEAFKQERYFDKYFEDLKSENIININTETLFIDSTTVKVHPDAMSGLKKEKQSAGRIHGGLTTKIDMITASERDVVVFSLSAGNLHNSREAIVLLDIAKYSNISKYIIMDRAYECKNVREAVIERNLTAVVPAKRNVKRHGKWTHYHIVKEARYTDLMFLVLFFLLLYLMLLSV